MGAAPIGKGDWVECVNNAPTIQSDFNDSLIALRVGGVYSVAAIFRDGDDALLLNEVRSSHPRGGYRVDHFRPIYKRDESLKDRLLSDIPADAPASPEEVVA